jgi:hypothetical protein
VFFRFILDPVLINIIFDSMAMYPYQDMPGIHNILLYLETCMHIKDVKAANRGEFPHFDIMYCTTSIAIMCTEKVRSPVSGGHGKLQMMVPP